MAFINLNPHKVDIIKEDGTVLTVPPSGIVARCSQNETVLDIRDSVKITRQEFGDVVNLPESKDGVLYIVSRLVAAARPDRKDLVCPGPLVRGDDGQPIGCKGLSVVW